MNKKVIKVKETHFLVKEKVIIKSKHNNLIKLEAACSEEHSGFVIFKMLGHLSQAAVTVKVKLQ